MHSLYFLFLLFGLLSSVSSQYSQKCSYEQMRSCRDSVDRNIKKRINDMSRQDTISHCNYIREEFNCLVQQTRCLSREDDRRKNDDILRNAVLYIRNGCDSLTGGWKDSSCYIGDGMKSCENSYPISSGHSSYSDENCRKYTQFHECVMHTLKNRCRPDDDRYLGQYLIDKGQELAWTCQDHSSGQLTDYDRDRNRESDRHDQYGNRDRDSTYRDRDGTYRDRDGTYRDRDGTYRDRDGTYRDRDRQSDRLPSDRYDDRYDSDRDRDRNSDDRELCCRREYCNRNRMDQCRDSLLRVIDDRHGSSSSYQQDERKCRTIRNDFNCLLWQTTCLSREERDRNSDVFRRAKDYISRTCDTYGRWNENSCYKSNEMQRCEGYLSNTRSGANFEACKSYNRFKECMTDALRNCAREDELYHGAYLVEKAMEMSWQCNNPDSDGRGGDRERDRYSPSGDRRNYDSYNTGSFFGGSGGSYEENLHLNDEEEMCSSKMHSYANACKREFEEKRRQLIIENDYDVKQKGQCCSARRYRTCLQDATKRVCHRESPRVVDKLLGRYTVDLNHESCRRIYDSECSSCNVIMAPTIMILFFIIMLFNRHSALSLF